MRDGLLELAHPGAERAADLRQPLRAEQAERDEEQEREVRGAGPADHACASLSEMSVTAAPATATSRRSGRSSSQSVYSPARQPVEHRAVERPAGDRPLVDLLVGAFVVAPRGADLDLRAVQVRAGVEDEGPDARPEVEHHVLGPGVGGVVVVVAHDDGVSYPSCGVPRYGNVAW